MEYGINIDFFLKTLSLAKAAELIAEAGFTKLDYTPDTTSDAWETEAKEALRIFGENGLSVHQTHVPFNRYGKYGDARSHKLCVDRCVAATEMMGARFMVAHGDEFDFNGMTFSPEAALDYNHDYFLPYVARGEKRLQGGLRNGI